MEKAIEERYRDLLTKHRRALHRIPELGDDVFETGRYIWEQLEACHPDELRHFIGTGIRAVFRCSREKAKTIAFRSDMDALPIEEKGECPFRSEHPGKMHACGHDGHMANLLTLAAWIADHRDLMNCNAVLIFQPAEETIGGAKRMIDEGVLKNPDADVVYGMHMAPDVPKGKIAVCAGPIMAQTSELNFHVVGQSAHGATPHKGKDAICAAAYLITALQALISRTVDPCKEALITIGRIEGGTQRNILAENVELQGICRTFSNEVYEALEKKMYAVCEGISAAFGVNCTLTRGVYYPCTENSSAETENLIRLLGKRYLPAVPKMTAEDFSFYQLEVPGVFVFCGCMDDQYAAPLHSGNFGFDEQALESGFGLFCDILREYGEE